MISAVRLDEIRLWRLALPLWRPYHLSLGEIAAFDTILVEARSGERVGFGEATYVSGYTDERPEAAWELAQTLARILVSASPEEISSALQSRLHDAAFTVTALATALEMAAGHPSLLVEEPARLAVLGLVNAEDEPELSAEINELVARGFTTLKVKVGFDVDADSQRVRRVQRANRGRCRLRLDANQGYDRDEGMRFASALDPAAIELFEQPCDKDDWDAAVAVARVSTVPMMLDESIYAISDIDRAAATGAAAFVKLKVMKMGSLDGLADGLRRIRALGMEPVLGNGVATDLSNWMEACVARSLVSNALESNGFLKYRRSILTRPLRFERGAIVLEPDFVPQLDENAVADQALTSAVVRRSGRIV